MPSSSTAFPLLILLIKTYVGPGPRQHPVKFTVWGRWTGPLLPGSRVAVSEETGVSVMVGGGGVGEEAAAVSVSRSEAAWATAVPTASIAGVALGVHALAPRIVRIPNIVKGSIRRSISFANRPIP